MKKGYILISVLFVFLWVLTLNSKSFAADLDEIINYVVTVEPNMNTGTLNIVYEFTWKVLDSTTEGPLTWVKIGTANDAFEAPIALTDNIRKIEKYNGSYVRIDFNQIYEKDDVFVFKYSIHQPYMYTLMNETCKYSFTPAWFTDSRVKNITIRWKADSVQKCNTKLVENNYYILNKTDLRKGEKVTINLEYNRSDFGYLYNNKQAGKENSRGESSGYKTLFGIGIVLMVIGCGLDGGYGSHRGFYGGYGGRGCVSSCACACARSCACACAGSGRAGCSRKDFYGTKINKKKIDAVLQKSE